MATDRSSSDRISMLYVDDEEELLELAMLYIGNKEGVNVDVAPSLGNRLEQKCVEDRRELLFGHP